MAERYFTDSVRLNLPSMNGLYIFSTLSLAITAKKNLIKKQNGLSVAKTETKAKFNKKLISQKGSLKKMNSTENKITA